MTHFHANCSEILDLNVFQTAQNCRQSKGGVYWLTIAHAFIDTVMLCAMQL